MVLDNSGYNIISNKLAKNKLVMVRGFVQYWNSEHGKSIYPVMMSKRKFAKRLLKQMRRNEVKRMIEDGFTPLGKQIFGRYFENREILEDLLNFESEIINDDYKKFKKNSKKKSFITITLKKNKRK